MQTKCSPGWEVFNPIIFACRWLDSYSRSLIIALYGGQTGQSQHQMNDVDEKTMLLLPSVVSTHSSMATFIWPHWLHSGVAVKMGCLTPTGWLSLSTWFAVTSGEYFYTHKYNRSIFHTLCPLCEVHLPPSSLGVLVIHLLFLFFLRPLLPSQLLPINQCASIL